MAVSSQTWEAGVKPQTAQVLRYLREHASISDGEARMLLSCTNLSGRISDLHKDGIETDTSWHEDKNQFGKPVRFKRYRILTDDEKAAKMADAFRPLAEMGS
jgi:hypothetical protein